MADTQLNVVVELKDRISGALRNVSGQLDNLKNRTERAADASRTFALGMTAAAVGVGAFVAGGVKFTAEMETTRAGLLTLLGSAEKADATLARIKVEAARTPFEIGGLSQATQLLASVTHDGDKAIDTILNIGEGLAAMGKGQVELDRIIVNLQQIGAVGKASMTDIKQFAFAGIPIFEMLKEKTKLSGDALTKFVEDGGVTFDLLNQMFDEANDKGGRFFNAYVTQAGTLNQVWSNFKDTLNVSLGDLVVQTGLFEILKVVLTEVTKALPPLIEGIKNVILFLKDHQEVLIIIAGAIVGALIPAIVSATFAFAGLAIALAPFILTGILIGGLVAGLVWLVKNWEIVKTKAAEIWTSIANGIKKNWENILLFISNPLGLIVKMVVENWGAIQKSTKSIWEGVGGIVSAVWEGIKNTVKAGINFVIDKINSFIRLANSVTSIASAIGVSIPAIPEIPRLAKGGIVTKPTLAMVGEAGPEAVIPLNRARGGSGIGYTINITVNGDISGQDIVDKVGEALIRKLQLSSAAV